MARPSKYTKAAIAEALEKAHGLRTIAARVLNCSPRTIHKYIERYPDLAEIVEYSTIERFERAWLKLDDKIGKGEPWAIQTALRYELERAKLAQAAKGQSGDFDAYCERMGIDPADARVAIRISLSALATKRLPSVNERPQLATIQAENAVQP